MATIYCPQQNNKFYKKKSKTIRLQEKATAQDL